LYVNETAKNILRAYILLADRTETEHELNEFATGSTTFQATKLSLREKYLFEHKGLPPCCS
jgi:hypothetical protein